MATQPPVTEAVRVPPSAWSTSQSSQMVRGPSALRSTTARSERPISRWISDERPSSRPAEMSRCLRSIVEYGSMLYSAVSQPPPTFWYFIHRGTSSCTVAAQMTRVLPNETRVDPVAWGAIPDWKVMGRSWS